MTDTTPTDSDAHNRGPGSAEASLTDSVLAGMPRAIADLSKLVRIPSVSWASFDPAQVAKSAEAVADLARGTGIFDSVSISRAPIGTSEELGQPAVLAVRRARNSKPTVLLYAHHDVQPPGSESDWDTKPFEPTVKGDRLYGRGASDDKAGVMTHIAAIRALVEETPDPDLGLVLFIEGEEEFGSRSFSSFLAQHRTDLAADVIVVADSDNVSPTVPALTVALRGNVTFQLTVRTLAHASHSGMFGGAVPDAMMAMVRILDRLWDEDGSVAVPGLTKWDTETPEFSEAQLRQDAGLLEGVRPVGRGPILNRLWAQPSITVTGIDAPSVAHASNTLIPRATVRVSVRIAPGQHADSALAALRAHIEATAPFGAQVQISDIDAGEPFLVDTSGWAVQEARKAMADGWGSEPVETGIGGSIPFISDLAREFPDAQILVTGVEDPDTRAHSPNESLHLGVFRRAILTEALLLHRLNNRTV